MQTFLIVFSLIALLIALFIGIKFFKNLKEINRKRILYALENLYDPLDNEQLTSDVKDLVIFSINYYAGKVAVLTKLKNAELYKEKGPSAFPILHDSKVELKGFYLVGLGYYSKFMEPTEWHDAYFTGWPGDNYVNFEKFWKPNEGNIFPVSWELISKIY